MNLVSPETAVRVIAATRTRSNVHRSNDVPSREQFNRDRQLVLRANPEVEFVRFSGRGAAVTRLVVVSGDDRGRTVGTVSGPLSRRQDRRRRNTHSHGGPVMLVLSRRIGERLVIDGNITVTVVEIRDGQIRLGIEAPKEIPVRREEVAARREMVAA